MLVSIIIFLGILSVLVLIHELGHYLVAKRLGIKVEEFGFGFPPRVWGVKRGETIFSINLFPIGGFVKLFGEDAAGGGKVQVKSEKLKVQSEGDVKRAFYVRPPGQRALVAVAGVVMNFLLAAIIFYVFLGISNFKTELPKLTDYNFFLTHSEVRTDVIIGEVVADSPAASAGIIAPSAVTEVNGSPIGDVEDFISEVDNRSGHEVAITLRNLATSKEYTVEVTPRVDPPEGQGALGVALYPLQSYVLSFPTPILKLLSGVTYPLNLMAYNIEVIAHLVSQSFEQKSVAPVGEGVSGPVGIFAVVNEVVKIPDIQSRFMQILNLAGLLSISLAFFNILPIPALDGGRLLFIGFEKVFGRPIGSKYESYAHAVGMIVLLGLLVVITIRDIGRFF